MTYLRALIDATRARISATKESIGTDALEQRVAGVEAPRGFASALQRADFALIAEIKRASPRTGPLKPDLNAGELADAYKKGGAAALSVLTEPDYFNGSFEDLEAARATHLPVLRKDFILDPYQVLESRAAGADAVLLIVRILDAALLTELVATTRSLGMDALVEVHTDAELEAALDAGATLVGVNHRDLETFEVDPERTAKLAPRVPSDVVLVGLSGVSTRDDVQALRDAGAAAALVGTSLVTADDPAAAIRELLGR